MATPVEIAVRTSGVARAKADMRGLSGEASRTGQSLKRMATVGAAAAVAGLGAFGKASVTAASEAQQSLGATQTVFGKFAGEVVRESKRAAQAVGLSANEYRELANVSGAMLASSGLPLRKVTDLTAQLNKRAADVSATFGGSAKEAVEAFGSLLRGEADPVERYGVSIKQSDVNARLAAKGLDDLTGKSLKQAEAQARLKLLFEQTAKSAGQFKREADTLAGQQQRLSASWDDLKAKAGTALLPLLTEAAEAANAFLPKLEALAPSAQEVSAGLKAVAREGRPAWELLKDLGGVASGVAGVLADLPGPVKSLGIQAGIAALALPRLNAGISSVSTSAQTMIGNLRNAETRTRALTTGARNLAGVGGLLAIAQGAQTSNDALKGLANVAGGALLGSAAGPLGTGIGAVVGGLATLVGAANEARDAATRGQGSWKDYASTLDAVTGATSEATRAMVHQNLIESGAIKSLAAYGITARNAVDAALGRGKASRQVAAALSTEDQAIGSLRGKYARMQAAAADYTNAKARETAGSKAQRDALREEIDVRTRALAGIRNEVVEVKKSVRAKREEIAATADYTGKLKGLPKRLVTEIKADGIIPTVRSVAQLADRYKLTPKRIRTLVEASGVATTVRDVQRVIDRMDDTSRTRANLSTFKGTLTGELAKAKAAAATGAEGISGNLRDGTGRARPDLSGFGSSLRGQIDGLRGTAGSGGHGIGAALGQGVSSGIGDYVGDAVNAAANLVSQAIAAARARAKAKSPSRETMRLGRDMGDGLAIGLRQSTAKNQKASKALIQRLLADLDRARDKLRGLTQQSREYAAGVKAAIVAAGDVTQLTTPEGEALTPASMLDQLKGQLRDAQRFADLVRKLRATGLNATSIEQLLAQGASGGLAAAETLAAGGKAAVNEVNKITRDLQTVGAQLGQTGANALHGAGINAAEGLIRGLKSRLRAIDRIGDRFGNRLAKAVKKSLGIKSPSTVFRGLGVQAAAGLRIGIETGNAHRIGEVLARDLVTGYGDPLLSATAVYAAQGGPGTAPAQMRIRLSADQASQLQRGREIIADVDYARGQGVRARSF